LQAAFRAVSGLDGATVEGISFRAELSRNLLKQFENGGQLMNNIGHPGTMEFEQLKANVIGQQNKSSSLASSIFTLPTQQRSSPRQPHEMTTHPSMLSNHQISVNGFMYPKPHTGNGYAPPRKPFSAFGGPNAMQYGDMATMNSPQYPISPTMQGNNMSSISPGFEPYMQAENRSHFALVSPDLHTMPNLLPSPSSVHNNYNAQPPSISMSNFNISPRADYHQLSSLQVDTSPFMNQQSSSTPRNMGFFNISNNNTLMGSGLLSSNSLDGHSLAPHSLSSTANSSINSNYRMSDTTSVSDPSSSSSSVDDTGLASLVIEGF
jgi:hypothetical protein